MADGRHIAKCWKRYNLPINGPIWMKLGWSHPTMSPTCPPWCSYHGTAHCTFSSYGRLEAECVNQIWWNLVHNSKLGPQWQSHDQILKFLKFKMADGRQRLWSYGLTALYKSDYYYIIIIKYSKCHNSPTNGPTGTQLGWSHPIMSPTCPPWRGCHGNSRCLTTAHWTFCSYGRVEAERVNQFWWNLVCNSKLGPQWQSHEQILNVKIQNGGRSLLESIRNVITRLQMDRLGCNLGGRIPLCSQYWKCYNSSYDGTDLYATPLLQNRFLGIWSLLLTQQWTFWFYGVSRSKTSTILMKHGWLCHCGTKNI